MRKVALYCRVSTDIQEKSETIDNQLRDLYKVYNKTEVVKVYQDNPGSGADPDRVGLWELRKDAQKKMFSVIGIWSSDRLARDTILALILRKEFKELGIKVEVMGKERDDSEDGKLLAVIESYMDEAERERIKKRFVSGRNRRLSEGKLIGCYPPFGYRHIRRNKETKTDAYFEINEQEAIIVRKIFDLYIKLESILMVTQQLAKEGIKGRGKDRLEPGFMQASSVSKILKRETYIGNHYFGKSSPCVAKFHIHKTWKHRYTGRRTNPRAEWKKVNVPAIIEQEIFEKAQAILKKRAKHRLEMSKYQFLCQGIIRCARCGRSYGGRGQDGYLFYRCPQAYTSNMNQPPCRSRTMGGNKLDNAVWNFVTNLINDKDKINKAIADLKEKKQKGKFSAKKSLDSLLSEKNTLRTKRKNLFDLYSESGLSNYAKEDLKAKLAEMDEKEGLLDSQILEIKTELEETKNVESLEKEIKETRRIYQNKIENPTFELKKYIVRKWIEEINILDDGNLKIKVRIPSGEVAEKEDGGLAIIQNQNLNAGLKFEELIMP